MKNICVLRLVVVVIMFAATTASAAESADADYVERVAAEHAGDQPESNVRQSDDGIDAGPLDYATIGGQPVTGYLARPGDQDGPLPAVILIHEWWGLNDNIRGMARRLAAAGYVALAVDLYRGETAEEPDAARRLMQQAMARSDEVRENLRQAFFYLDVMPSASRIGSIGWCFGGGWSLQTALLFPKELDAAVIYYGQLVTDPERLAPLRVPILGQFGGTDSSIPRERIEAFDTALTQLEVPHEIHVYPGAGHAFANPSGTRYDKAAADTAWRRTLEFLARYLKGRASQTSSE